MDTDLRGPVVPEDFNKMDSVAIFMGPLLEMYKTITLDGLKTFVGGAEKVALLDVSDKDAFRVRPLRGVVNIPVEHIERDAHALISEEDVVVIYGPGGVTSALSAVVADKLFTIGYEKILRFNGTPDEWREAGVIIDGTYRTSRKAA